LNRLDPAPFRSLWDDLNLVINDNGGEGPPSANGHLAPHQNDDGGGAGNDTILGSNGETSYLGGGLDGQ